MDMMASSCLILLLVLDANRGLIEFAETAPEDDMPNIDFFMTPSLERTTLPFDALCDGALSHFQMWSSNMCLDEDLGFWVKP